MQFSCILNTGFATSTSNTCCICNWQKVFCCLCCVSIFCIIMAIFTCCPNPSSSTGSSWTFKWDAVKGFTPVFSYWRNEASPSIGITGVTLAFQLRFSLLLLQLYVYDISVKIAIASSGPRIEAPHKRALSRRRCKASFPSVPSWMPDRQPWLMWLWSLPILTCL